MHASRQLTSDESLVTHDPRGVSEITILPDGRIYVLGLSQAVLDALADVQRVPDISGTVSLAANAGRSCDQEAG
jgi:hypothetical protein